jgi:hypothetical protein
MPISSTRLSCPLLGKAYVTSPVGSAFDPGASAKLYSTLILPPPSSPCRIPPWPQVLQITERFIMRPCLPYRHGNCVAAGLLGSPDITPVLRYYEPIHHRLAVSQFPGLAGYMTYPAPPISPWGEDGFSSCLPCPCHRAVPNTPPGASHRFSQFATIHAAFAQRMRARLPVPGVSRPSMGSLALRPGNSLTILTMALSVGFIRFVSSTDATQATGF